MAGFTRTNSHKTPPFLIYVKVVALRRRKEKKRAKNVLPISVAPQNDTILTRKKIKERRTIELRRT